MAKKNVDLNNLPYLPVNFAPRDLNDIDSTGLFRLLSGSTYVNIPEWQYRQVLAIKENDINSGLPYVLEIAFPICQGILTLKVRAKTWNAERVSSWTDWKDIAIV